MKKPVREGLAFLIQWRLCVHAVFGQAGPCGECADGVTVRMGVAEENFEGAVHKR